MVTFVMKLMRLFYKEMMEWYLSRKLQNTTENSARSHAWVMKDRLRSASFRSSATELTFSSKSAREKDTIDHGARLAETGITFRHSYLIAPTDLIWPTTNSGGICASSPHSLIMHSTGVRLCVRPPAALNRNNKRRLFAFECCLFLIYSLYHVIVHAGKRLFGFRPFSDP